MSASATPSAQINEQMLTGLLGALRARAVSHPGNPGLVAFWPAVQERQMAAACAELVRLGYPVQRVVVTGWQGAKPRSGWAFTDSALEPS